MDEPEMNESLAIDDISFVECSPNEREQVFSCNFDSDMCGWRNQEKLLWSQQKFASKNRLQMIRDHTTGNGKFACVYVFAGQNFNGKQARMTSLLFHPTPHTGQCFSFWYFMYGNGTGRLNMWLETLTVSADQNRTLWYREGSQVDDWKRAEVNLVSLTEFRIMFEAILGDTHFTNIALDDMEISSHACKPRDECDFEDNWCFLQNSQSSKLYGWHRGNRLTPLDDITGPVVDHTIGFPQGHYLFVSSKWKFDDEPKKDDEQTDEMDEIRRFRVESNRKFTVDNEHSLVFWYHMIGNIGSLSVKRHFSDGNQLLWRRSGDQLNIWHMARVNLNSRDSAFDSEYSDKEYYLYFDVERNKTESGDNTANEGHVAIDDVEIRELSSEDTRHFCDFERDFCGWSNAINGFDDDIDWIRQAGETWYGAGNTLI